MSELAKALTAFHANLPEVGKGSTNPAFRSRYADLADIVKVVLPALAAQGLAWVALPTVTDHGFVLAYKLTHISGESVEGSWPLPDPDKANAQALGSAVTYAKRYTLSAVTGIAPDEDDDGNAASAGTPAARAKPTPRAAAKADADDRVKNVLAAISEATTLEALDGVWKRVVLGGLDGVVSVKKAYDDAARTFPPSTGDAWAVAEVQP